MFEMLLGHLAGDYLFQNEFLAMNKSKNTGVGWLSALVHCIIYTLTICLFMQNFDWIWIVVVFLTHFPIDKFSLAEKYMHYVKGKIIHDQSGSNLQMRNIFEAAFYKGISNDQELPIERAIHQLCGTIQNNLVVEDGKNRYEL